MAIACMVLVACMAIAVCMVLVACMAIAVCMVLVACMAIVACMATSGMYGPTSGMYGPHTMGPMGMYGSPMPGGDPNAPSAWQAMLGGIGSMVHFFGRLSFLVDENAHAVHFFISALLQLLDRFGSLYGELARFILRLLGVRKKESMDDHMAMHRDAKGHGPDGQQKANHHPKAFDATWQNTMGN